MILIKRIAIAVSSVVLFFGIGILVAQVQLIVHKSNKISIKNETKQPKVAGVDKKATNKTTPYEEKEEDSKKESIAKESEKTTNADLKLDEPEENPEDIIEDPEAENL